MEAVPHDGRPVDLQVFQVLELGEVLQVRVLICDLSYISVRIIESEVRIQRKTKYRIQSIDRSNQDRRKGKQGGVEAEREGT